MYKPSHERPFDLIDMSRTTARSVIARLRGFTGGYVPPETPEQAAERRASQRADAAADLTRTEAERDQELPRLAAAEEKARKRLESLTPGYQQAVADYDRARMVHLRRANDFAYMRTTILRRIEVAAEPEIDEFMADMNGLLQANFTTPVESDRKVKGYRATDRGAKASIPVYEFWSNTPSINARRIAILAARQTAEDMKSDPDQSDIRERLIALVEALPDNAVMVKVD